MNIYQFQEKGNPIFAATQPQVDLIMSLQEGKDLSERELVEFARSECGVMIPLEGGVTVLKRLSRRDASGLIDGLREED